MKPNFYDDNRNRAFPFVKHTVGVATPSSGVVTMRQLPHDFIVDCGFVLGPESKYVDGVYTIYLNRVYRTGSTVNYEFASDCPSLIPFPLTFSRSLSDSNFAVEHVESPGVDADECREPLWSGYMVSGVMSSVAARLADGDSVTRATGDAVVEPALLQNLNNSLLSSVELANGDRTRITSPEGCSAITWPYQTGGIYLGARCIKGDIKLKPGYNCVITQNSANNTITLSAAQKAGEGQPCAEVPVFTGESPQNGSTNELLSGGPLCNETLRSINGIGGPLFSLLRGAGVSVIPDPENNRIVVDVNLSDLSICWSDMSIISESI